MSEAIYLLVEDIEDRQTAVVGWHEDKAHLEAEALRLS